MVGLYLNPPDQAVVFCADKKSQIQALDWTQPGLPLEKGRCGTMTHDYKRHGTTTLFAALDVLTGEVLGTCQPRHRHQEWIQFLKRLDRATPPDRPLHLIVELCDPQASGCPPMGAAASTVPHALHPHEQFLAESHRTVVS